MDGGACRIWRGRRGSGYPVNYIILIPLLIYHHMSGMRFFLVIKLRPRYPAISISIPAIASRYYIQLPEDPHLFHLFCVCNIWSVFSLS